MVGLDFASRLEMLKDNFGVRFRFAEAPEDEQDEQEDKAINSEDEMSEGISEQASPRVGHCQLVPAPAPSWGQASAIEESAADAQLDCSKFCVGEATEDNIDFCLWRVIQTYPEHFIGRANKPRAQPYFDKILEGRIWDFFYLHNPEKPSDQPRLLVPSIQLESFLRGINRDLGTSLAIPGGVNQDRFYMKFGQGGTPRPRYLQRSRDQKTMQLECWTKIHESDIEGYKVATPMMQQAWKNNWNMMTPRAPNRDKKKGAERRAAQRKLDRERMLHEAQDYLNNSEKLVVFICMDVEAIEVAPGPISEVGIAILDTKDIHGVPPGPCGQNWWQFIEAHHLRTKEYSGLVNHRFVKGCPGNFDFGFSTFPAKAELASAIESLLEPFTDEDRELVFVGHDGKQDVKYLSSIGFEVFQLKHMLGQLDTKEMHQAWVGSDNGRSLETVLSDVAIISQHLHNAGNDAVYTLRAMIGVAIEQAREQEAKEKGEEYVPALWSTEGGDSGDI